MESARWSPPIPTGAAALTAWRELDRGTRHDLLRSAVPHPDPAVACIAVGYARTKLQNRVRPVLRRLALILGLVVATIIATALVVAAGGGQRVAVDLPAILVVPAVLLLSIGGARHRLRLIRMENVNAPALLAGETPMQMPPTAAGTPLDVRFDRRATLRTYIRPTVVFVLVGALLPLVLHGIVPIALITVMALSLAMIGYQLVRWVLPGRPVLVMDGGGLRFGITGLSVAWTEVSEIRIHPLRSNRGSDARVIAFVCADPWPTIARMRGLRRWSGRQALRYYGSPVVLASRTLDHTVEEIAAAATSFHPVPVRRFGT